jgi:hypothetical protein
MSSLPTRAQLESLDDERLEQLATGWRAQALRGDRRAFCIAHAGEVERRRRLRGRRLQALPPLQPPPRPWWKFWQRVGPDDSNR